MAGSSTPAEQARPVVKEAQAPEPPAPQVQMALRPFAGALSGAE